jgi:hypothetical protein
MIHFPRQVLPPVSRTLTVGLTSPLPVHGATERPRLTCTTRAPKPSPPSWLNGCREPMRSLTWPAQSPRFLTCSGHVADVQPDLLRLASRSIAAKARTYGHPAAQWEISVDSVSAFFELADVLVDLQAFVRTDLEAHEQAVREHDLTPEKAPDAKIALDLVTKAIRDQPRHQGAAGR